MEEDHDMIHFVSNRILLYLTFAASCRIAAVKVPVIILVALLSDRFDQSLHNPLIVLG